MDRPPRVGSERNAPGNMVSQLGVSDLDFERDRNGMTNSQSVKLGSPGALAVKMSRQSEGRAAYSDLASS